MNEGARAEGLGPKTGDQREDSARTELERYWLLILRCGVQFEAIARSLIAIALG